MRLHALDYLRFFAAFFVVMYHYTARQLPNSSELLSEITKFGYLGVPLFFMISGYVILLSASHRTAFEFAIARLVRLYPVYWTCIVITLITTYLYGQYDYSVGQILANLTMLNDYLGYESIDGVYWTLHAELKFYACIFLLLFFDLFKKTKIWLSIWLGLTIVHLITDQPFFMGWLISPHYSSFFIAGISFRLIQEKGLNTFNLSILFFSFVVSSFRGFDQALDFMKEPSICNQYASVVIIWIFYILFYLLVTGKINISKTTYSLALGGLTYPLYLIHNIPGKAIIDSSYYINSYGLRVVLVITIMLILSYLIHLTIDKKLSPQIKTNLLKLIEKIEPRKVSNGRKD